jgi:hypothetical protein
MTPRTVPTGYTSYVCLGRLNHGKAHCPQRPIKRELIDNATFRYFADVALDAGATREQIKAQLDQRLAEVGDLREQAEQAEQAEQEAAQRVARVRRDYSDGKLSAEDWESFKIELTPEHDAAKAELERLREQERETAEGRVFQDAEQETVEYLAWIRVAVAGEVDGAEGLEAVRSSLVRLFERFELRRFEDADLTPREGEHRDAVLAGGYLIEPKLRAQAVVGYTDGMVPVLDKQPLYKAENKGSKALQLEPMGSPRHERKRDATYR